MTNDPRWASLIKLSQKLKIARGRKRDDKLAERVALAIITLQRDMKMSGQKVSISDFRNIFEKYHVK